MNRPNQIVLFADGSVERCEVLIWHGPCLVGDATAYVRRNGKYVWVRPGQSVQWVEVEG